jgi:hypothetical protein
MGTYTLGFTSKFYTLWEVGEPEKKYSSGATINGVFNGTFQWVQKCTYLQNLSTDFNKAVSKITELSKGQFVTDLDLRGHSTFTRACGGGNDMPDHVFTFGQLMGKDIREATDVWQLRRAAKEETGKRRRAIARRRLIDLGALVRDTTGLGDDKYITPTHFKYLLTCVAKNAGNGHHFENGKRITVAVRRVGGTSWTSQYGYREVQVYLVEYMTEDGKLLKYKGSSPLQISETDGLVNVTGTVQHGVYNGEPETRLLRMKKI